MFPTWHISATESNGLLGGLSALWDPTSISVKAFRCFSGILLSTNFCGIPGSIHILNVHAPYKDHFSFWNHFILSKIMELDSLMIARDLNCTLSGDELWEGVGR